MTAQSNDTPRTNEAAVGFARVLVDRENFKVTEIIPADFARDLERELATLQARLAEVEQDLNDARNGWEAAAESVREAERERDGLRRENQRLHKNVDESRLVDLIHRAANLLEQFSEQKKNERLTGYREGLEAAKSLCKNKAKELTPNDDYTEGKKTAYEMAEVLIHILSDSVRPEKCAEVIRAIPYPEK